MKRELLTGNEAAIKGAIASGAKFMTGYPITPTTEMMEHWAEAAVIDKSLKFLQTEDEMSAGFAMIGAILAGVKSFSATAGPGNILMQDAFSMAENMRLPTVAFINQRGGPSTGTVIYSQQEVNLTCFGGNGEGLRIVYSASSGQEMYDLAIKAFNTAWKYRFPTFILADGYQAKTLTEIETYMPQEKQIEIVEAEPYLLGDKGEKRALRNTYNLEEDLHFLIEKHESAFEEASDNIVEYEEVQLNDAELVIFAHGIIGASAKEAVKILRGTGAKIGLFRPITLNPFPRKAALDSLTGKKYILLAESSLGQFERIVKYNLYGTKIAIEKITKPAMGITAEEIVQKVEEITRSFSGTSFS